MMWSSILIIGQITSVRLNFFQIMREAKLTINLMKSEFGKATVKYLGHIVDLGQVRPLDAKFKPLQNSLSRSHGKNLLDF